MKKNFTKLFLCLVTFIAVASASVANESPTGFVFKEVIQAGGGSGGAANLKVGCSECTSYFGFVAIGDCSIQSAMKQGNITKLSHYDEEILNILGYKKITIKAYGQ